MQFIGFLCLILSSTTLLGHFSKKVGVPAVIGQILAGIFFGNSFLNLIEKNYLLEVFSEIGVILLMFLAGLESDLSLLKKYFKPGMYVASLGIFFPLIFVWMGGIIYKIPSSEACFFGVILAATSVSISVEVIKELNLSNTKESATILAASIVDDVLVVLSLSLGTSFFSSEHISSNLLVIIFKELLYFICIFILVKWVAIYFMKIASKISMNSIVTIISLIICLGMSYASDFIGLSSVLGAFFSGVSLGQTNVKKVVHRNIESIGYSIFIPLFFFSIGLEVEFSQFLKSINFIIIFTTLAIFSKLLGGYIGGKCSNFKTNSALMVGAGMISRGEMSLIILKLGIEKGLINISYCSPLIITILISTLVSPLLLKFFARKIYLS